MFKNEAQPRVLLYLVRPAAGGMRGHVQTLLEHFSRSHAVSLAAPALAAVDSDPAHSAYRRLDYPLCAGIRPVRDARSCLRLYRMLQEARPALVHIHGFKAALVGLPATRLTRVPALVTVHNYPADWGRLFVPLLKNTAGRGGKVKVRYIAVSQALAREITGWGIPRDRVSVIYNGIDPAPFEEAGGQRRFRGAEQGLLVVGTVARMAWQKGLPYFLKAAARLAPLFPQMRFLLVGDGPERANLENLARRLGLGSRVSFAGYCTDLPAQLAQIDIFVLSSLTEGLAITLLEAAAAGCVPVGTQVGGVPEVIEDGVSGRLVPPGDDRALASAVAALIRYPEQSACFSRAAREKVRRRFSLAGMLEQTEAVYAQVIQEAEDRTKETRKASGTEQRNVK